MAKVDPHKPVQTRVRADGATVHTRAVEDTTVRDFCLRVLASNQTTATVVDDELAVAQRAALRGDGAARVLETPEHGANARDELAG